MKLELDTETIAIVEVNNELILSTDFDQALAHFLEHKKQMEEFETVLKEKLTEAVTELNPQFSTLVGDKCKITLSPRGAKYQLLSELVPDEFVKVETKIDSKAVDEHLKNEGTLPEGIGIAERTKSLTITLRK